MLLKGESKMETLQAMYSLKVTILVRSFILRVHNFILHDQRV